MRKTIENFQIRGQRNENISTTTSKGEKGEHGEKGDKGDKGDRGDKGDKGDKGDRGEIGQSGRDGKDGRDGKMGERGLPGQNGEPGRNGINGRRGERGEKGESGERGEPGKQGQRGRTGNPGSIASGSCKLFGSDRVDGWNCPDDYPIYTGVTMGSQNGLTCGSIAKNASCKGNNGSNAEARVNVINGAISSVEIINSGNNYLKPPHCRIISSSGSGAIVKANVFNGQVTEVIVIQPGKNYSQAIIEFDSADSGHSANLKANISDGSIESIDIISGGKNYNVEPKLKFIGNGQSAKAIPIIRNGSIVSVQIIDKGKNYTFPPIISVIPGISRSTCKNCHMCCKRTQPTQLNNDVYNTLDKIQEKLELQQHEMFELARNYRTSLPVSTYSNQSSDSSPKSKSKSKPIPKIVTQEEIDTILEKVDTIGKGTENNISASSFSISSIRNKSDSNNDITKLGTISQSSTFDGKIATNAVDGNLQTYSSTAIRNDPSWLKITFPSNMEINKIAIRNRMGNDNILRRLVPLNVNIYNSNEMLVSNTRLTDIKSEYSIDINIIGKIVELKQETPNYLHIAEIKIFGKIAETCNVYLDNFKVNNSAYNTASLTATGLTTDLKNRYNISKSLSDSCNKLSSEDTNARSALVLSQAEAYDKILSTKQEQMNIKKNKALQLYDKVQAEKNAELATEEIARKLGINAPPPPKYTQKQIDIIKKTMNYKPRVFTIDEKAKCMTLLQESLAAKQQAHDIGIKVSSMPELADQAKSLAENANKLWDNYKLSCSDNQT